MSFWAVGSLLLATGFSLWMTAWRPLAGFFVALHITMVCLFALPYIAALRAARREDGHD